MPAPPSRSAPPRRALLAAIVLAAVLLALAGWLLGRPATEGTQDLSPGDRVEAVVPTGPVLQGAPPEVAAAARAARAAATTPAAVKPAAATPAAAASVVLEAEPPPVAARSLPFRLEVVDGETGRPLKTPWRLLPAVVEDPPKEEPWPAQVVVGADGRVDRKFAVDLRPGTAAWEEPRVLTVVARRAQSLRHVYPLRPEAAVRLSVTDANDRPVRATVLTAHVAGREVPAGWRGDGAGRVTGLPYLRREAVELRAQLLDADGRYERVGAWTGRFTDRPQHALQAAIRLPPDWIRLPDVPLGIGGSGSGEFRGRLREAAERTGSLEVKVLGRDGAPLADVQVVLGGHLRRVRTNAAGVAVFAALAPGEFEVRTEEVGVVTARANVRVAAEQAGNLVLREPEGGTLVVDVVDEAGESLPFAEVSVDDPTWCDLADDGTQRTDPYTDARGRRSLFRVAPGEVRVRAAFGQRHAEAVAEVAERRRTTVTLVVK